MKTGSTTFKPPAPPGATGFMRPVFQKKKPTDYPTLPTIISIPSVALSTLIMAYSGLFGIYPILVLYGLWLPRAYYKGQIVLRPSKDIYLVLAFVAYCAGSTLWSNYPQVSLHNSFEYASMIACTIIMSRIVPIDTFMRGLIAGCMMVLCATILNGDYDIGGLFGSKNQVGLFAEIGLFASIVYFFAKNSRLNKLAYGIGPLMVFTFFLFLSHSGTSLVTLILVLFICYTAYFVARFSPRRRKAVLVTVIVCITLGSVAALFLGEQQAVLEMMGKDATLTGRTWLWEKGLMVGMQDPILGHGYGAFWVPGQPQAEEYWYKFSISGRTGFHFHNLYIQTFVDLGGVGLLMMVTMIFGNCVKSVREVIRYGANMHSIACIGFSCMFMLRACAEVDYLGPFAIGVMLFFAMPPRLAALEAIKEKLEQPKQKPRRQYVHSASRVV